MRRIRRALALAVALLVCGGPAGAVSTPPVVGAAARVTPTQPAGAPQDCPDLAAGSDQFLAVWEDKRHPGNDDVYGQRLAPAGGRLGSAFPISTAAGGQFCPRAAWSGSAWLVAWTDARTGSSDIRAATITAGGSVVPAGGFVLASAASEQRQPAVTFDGTNFVVAWSDRRTGSWAIRAARVRPDRTILDPSGLVVATGTGGRLLRLPSAAGRDGVSVIAWSETCGACSGATRARVLRTTGFAGQPVLLSNAVGASQTTAAPARLLVTFRQAGAVHLAHLDPATGAVVRRAALAGTSGARDFDVLEYDGQRLVATIGGVDSEGGVVRTVQTSPVAGGSLSGGTSVAQPMLPASVAVLPNGRAGLSGMDPGTGRLWFVPVS